MLADIVVGLWGLSVLGALVYGAFRLVVALVPPETPVLGRFKRSKAPKPHVYQGEDDFPFSELPATYDPPGIPNNRL